MTPLFWIALSWVLTTYVVSRMPIEQRKLPGAVLAVAAVPIILSIAFQIGFLAALFASVGALSLFPNVLRLAQARYRGEKVKIDANVLRYLAVPGEL